MESFQCFASLMTPLVMWIKGEESEKEVFAIYLEPWHADIFDFLDLKKNHGKEEMRARDLFYAMWVPDLFMERVEEDSTMDPHVSE